MEAAAIEPEVTETENNLEVEASESAETPETTESTESEQPEKRGRSAEDRIRELAAREKAAMEYAEYWRSKATDGVKPETEAPKEEPAPKLADFEGDHEKWASAHAEWTEKQIDRRAAAMFEQQTTRQREETAKSQMTEQWESRCAEFAEKNPDFYDVIGNPTLPITKTMSEVLQSSEKGVEVAYHLATNPGEAAKIARMSASQQAAALGRLEAKLDRPAPKPKTTDAPEPPNPVTASSASRVDIETMSAKEYLNYKMKKAMKR